MLLLHHLFSKNGSFVSITKNICWISSTVFYSTHITMLRVTSPPSWCPSPSSQVRSRWLGSTCANQTTGRGSEIKRRETGWNEADADLREWMWTLCCEGLWRTRWVSGTLYVAIEISDKESCVKLPSVEVTSCGTKRKRNNPSTSKWSGIFI